MNIDFKKTLPEIRKIRVSLNQMCYIIPIILVLFRYFDLEFFYITDGIPGRNEVCLTELNKYRLIRRDDKSNLIYCCQREFIETVKLDFERYGNGIIYYTNNRKQVFGELDSKIIRQIAFHVDHGIDEEGFLQRQKYTETVLDYSIFAVTHSTSVVGDYDIIDSIYFLDKSKKTILFQDTGRTFTHLLPNNDYPLKSYQDKMFDDLIRLKQDYNVIIRFHPVYYHSSVQGYNCICKKVLENFIIDFTQISLMDLYSKADIIITNRSTSSGYQSLFLLDKNIIMIDMDLDVRKKALFEGYKFGYPMQNDYLVDLMRQGKIFSSELGVCGFENRLSIYDEVRKIEANNFDVSSQLIEKRLQFIRQNWNITQSDIDDPHKMWYFMIYIFSQLKGMEDSVTDMLQALMSAGLSREKIDQIKGANTLAP